MANSTSAYVYADQQGRSFAHISPPGLPASGHVTWDTSCVQVDVLYGGQHITQEIPHQHCLVVYPDGEQVLQHQNDPLSAREQRGDSRLWIWVQSHIVSFVQHY